jgi:hypothetical protein
LVTVLLSDWWSLGLDEGDRRFKDYSERHGDADVLTALDVVKAELRLSSSPKGTGCRLGQACGLVMMVLGDVPAFGAESEWMDCLEEQNSGCVKRWRCQSMCYSRNGSNK